MKAKKFIRVNPQITVNNLRQTLDYYRDELGFYDEWTWTNSEGNIIDGGIRKDDMRLLFSEDPGLNDAINNYKKSRFPLMWFVDNIDEVFCEFQSRNIELADSLREHAYGLKEFSFIDINGYYIRVAESNEE
jgi:uncharacterized glyoxalase superfamily protein PhnB